MNFCRKNNNKIFPLVNTVYYIFDQELEMQEQKEKKNMKSHRKEMKKAVNFEKLLKKEMTVTKMKESTPIAFHFLLYNKT